MSFPVRLSWNGLQSSISPTVACSLGVPLSLSSKFFFNLLTVDAVVLPISTAGVGWRTRIVGVMSPKTAASDEWMYELQESSNNSRYSDANLGFEAFMDGDHSKTKRIVEKLSDGMHDPESMSVGETLKKLITAQPPVDGKRYANPMTDYYRQCVLSNGAASISGTGVDLDRSLMLGTTGYSIPSECAGICQTS
eukprot:Tbor_TRINITY_DN5986_c0_g1::TRINITY_DN5986_c0_g1_i19::g.18193::m.18193